MPKQEAEKDRKIYIGIATVMVLIASLAAYQLYSFSSLKTQLQDSQSLLEQKLAEQEYSLKTQMLQQASYDAEQRLLLRNETNQNFRILQDYFSTEQQKLKLNLESQVSSVEQSVNTSQQQLSKQLSDVEKASKKRISELEAKLDDIDVQSSDFSAIIPEVVKSVVSVITDKGQGSGAIVTEDGYIITNRHVVEGASLVRALTYDDAQHTVTVIGYASSADLAVLKMDGIFQALEFADSDTASVGNRVIAIGNPGGLGFSVTEGIISALNRIVDSTNVPYIQTDVPINPGNSGGPLVLPNRKIIGINTKKIAGFDGVGFAIPSNIVKSIVEQAIS